ncbi:MAG: D-tyrosyl-tRNA(Tyr) deacylase [Actinobacteria bacterium]|nr:D-tyrosyl-tRNA(Tyr) deacylase [Actinomycetota bacterium]
MRAVVQRVSQASVAVGGKVAGAISEPGLLVLVGVTHGDTPAQAARLAARLWGVRILDGEKSCSDVGAPLLVISQFTLYAELSRGRRPSWSAAAPGPVAEPLVDAVVQALRDLGARVETGVFGAAMKVTLTNDGPVTLIIDVLALRLQLSPEASTRPARTAAGPAARPGPGPGTRRGRTNAPARRSSAGWTPRWNRARSRSRTRSPKDRTSRAPPHPIRPARRARGAPAPR